MLTNWLIVCNSIKADIFDISKNKLNGSPKSRLLKEFEHPEGRMKGVDLVADGPGHYKARGRGRGKFTAQTTPHETELLQFAHQIAKFLEHERVNQHYQSLIVCAGPHFQGVLEKCLSSHVKQMVTKHIIKDYIPLEGNQLKKVVSNIQHL